jgi:hypothetical protein
MQSVLERIVPIPNARSEAEHQRNLQSSSWAVLTAQLWLCSEKPSQRFVRFAVGKIDVLKPVTVSDSALILTEVRRPICSPP